MQPIDQKFSISDVLLRNEKKGSVDLCRAFFLALFFHLFFIVLFQVASQKPTKQLLPLPFSSVEVDLGEKSHLLLPSSNELVLIFPEENPMHSLFSMHNFKYDFEENRKKHSDAIVNHPDFFNLEMIPYTPYNE